MQEATPKRFTSHSSGKPQSSLRQGWESGEGEVGNGRVSGGWGGWELWRGRRGDGSLTWKALAAGDDADALRGSAGGIREEALAGVGQAVGAADGQVVAGRRALLLPTGADGSPLLVQETDLAAQASDPGAGVCGRVGGEGRGGVREMWTAMGREARGQ